jgi:hypothetical protein
MRNKMNKVEKIQVANGFTAINCEDGFRKDNRLWFGECSVCGERITNSALDGIWTHTKYSEIGHYTKEYFDKGLDGLANFTSSKSIDYCPKVVGETNETIRWYKVDGEKFFA